MIRRIRRTLPWFGAVAALLLLAVPVQADDIEPETAAESSRNIEKFFDLLLVRPLYLARLVIGVPFMVVYPLTLGSGYAEDVVALLWTDPYEATFKRSLGEAPGDY